MPVVGVVIQIVDLGFSDSRLESDSKPVGLELKGTGLLNFGFVFMA